MEDIETIKESTVIARMDGCTIWKPDERLVIDSDVELPDWEVRKFMRHEIHFLEHVWMIAEVHHATIKPIFHRYVLIPWPENDHSTRGSKIEFNRDYLSGIRRERTQGGKHHLAFWTLVWFLPLLGLLWKGHKRRLAMIGFDLETLTYASLFLCFVPGLFFTGMGVATGIQFSFLQVDSFVNALLGITLVVDTVQRFIANQSNMQRNDYGFLEWAFRPKSEDDD